MEPSEPSKKPRRPAGRRHSVGNPISLATREAILRAAEAEFAARGFGGARADAIAARAGVNKALPFYHFVSKARLYDEVLSRALGRLGEIVALMIESPNPEERLVSFVRDLSSYLAANPNWLRIIVRELIDDGSRAKAIARRYLKPLVDISYAEIVRGIEGGHTRPMDPLQIMVSIAAEVTFYFLVAPFLEGLGMRQPLSAASLAKREEVVLTLLKAGLKNPKNDAGSLPPIA